LRLRASRRPALQQPDMTAVESFLDMGGYAAFVWPAYGVAALVLIGVFLQRWRRLRAAERALGPGSNEGRRR